MRDEPIRQDELHPYFEGPLPEGLARQSLAASLQIPEDRWVDILVACGRECMGDIVTSTSKDRPTFNEAMRYEPVSLDAVTDMFKDAPTTSHENAARRLSLAGTQNKTGLAHDSTCHHLRGGTGHGDSRQRRTSSRRAPSGISRKTNTSA